MTDIGLWNIARTNPDRTAVVDPAGEEITYADLAAAADRYGRGMQERGLVPGDCIVVMLPNGIDLLAMYFAAIECGLYIVPINWHLTGPEVAYIVGDCDAKVFVADQRFATAAVIAAADLPAESRFAVGAIEGFQPLAELSAEGGRPDVRTQGAPMVYTSGTTGQPKGVKRPLTGENPDLVNPANIWFFSIFGLQPFDDHVHICGSPLYHTAVLNFVAISVQMGHTAVLMERFDAEEMLRLIDRYRVTHSHVVPTQFIRLLALPEDVRAKYDVSSLRGRHPWRRAVPERGQAGDARLVGPGRHRVLRRDRGRRRVDLGAGVAGASRARSASAWPGAIVKILDDDGVEVAPNDIGLVYMRMGNSSFDYHKE